VAADLLESMRSNPAGDWSIRDVEAICREYGLLFRAVRALRIAMQSIRQHRKF